MATKYTKEQLESALQRANSDPVNNSGIIDEITNMLRRENYATEEKDGDTGSLVFDDLNTDESYNESLYNFYDNGKASNPDAKDTMLEQVQTFKPDSKNLSKNINQMKTLSNWQKLNYDDNGKLDMSAEELKEKSFELFNSAMLNEVNLFRLGNEISTMPQSQRDSLAKMYDIYERTAMTGDGSRGLGEQLKDGIHMAYAPSTFVGGKFVGAAMMKPAFKLAMRKMLKEGLTKLSDAEKTVIKKAGSSYAKRSGVLGSAYTGGFDAGIQTQIEMGLDPEKKYDGKRTAKMAGVGFGLGYAMSKAPKVAGKVLRAPGALINKGLGNAYGMITSPLETTGGGIMKAFGGKKAARSQVVVEGTEAFGLKADDLDVSGHGLQMQGEVKNASQKALNNFKEDFQNLGDLGVDQDTILSVIRNIEDEIPGYGALGNIKKKLVNGSLSPTEALRKIRSKLGLSVLNTKNPNHPFADFSDDFIDASKSVREIMKEAANKSGKLPEFLKLDEDYGKFITANNDNLTQKLMTDNSSDTVARLRTLGKSSQDNIALMNEHTERLNIIAKYSGDRYPDGTSVANTTLPESNVSALKAIIGEQMFKGETGTGLNAYLGHDQGRKVLKDIFKGKEETIDRLSAIRQNSSDKGDMGMFAMRILTGTGAVVFGATGQVSSALATGAGFVGMETLLRSAWFRRAAANTFAKEPRKSLAEKIKLAKLLESKGYTARDANFVMKTVVGGAAWTAILADEDRRKAVMRSPQNLAESWLGKLATENKVTRGAIGNIAEYASQGVKYANDKLFQPTFDTVTDLLISDKN